MISEKVSKMEGLGIAVVQTNFSENYPSHYPTLTQLKKERKRLLINILNTSLFPSTLVGFFPLNFNRETGIFSFFWVGFPFFSLMFRVLFGVVCVLFYHLFYYKHYFMMMAKESTTEQFSQEFNAYVGYFGEISVTLILVWKRKAILQFQETFMDTILALPGSNENWNQRLSQILQETRFQIIAALVPFFFMAGINTLLQYKMSLENYGDEIPLFQYFQIVSTIYWSSTIFLRMLIRVWMISVVKCLLVAVTSLKERIISSSGAISEVKVILKDYRALENLVKIMNRNLGEYLAMGLLCLMVTLLMIIFEGVTHLEHGRIITIMDFALQGFLPLCLLYILCWNATELENEVKFQIIFRISNKLAKLCMKNVKAVFKCDIL